MFDNKLIAIFNTKKEKLISGFNFPEWLHLKCFGCSGEMGRSSIQALEVSFVPSFLGDLVITYLCDECSSCYCMHLKAGVKNFTDVADVLESSVNTWEFIDRNELLGNDRHNLIERWKDDAETTDNN
jgi:hypothetical protein